MPDALRMAAAAGVRITANQMVEPDQFGFSLLDNAKVRGQEFVDALMALIMPRDGAP